MLGICSNLEFNDIKNTKFYRNTELSSKYIFILFMIQNLYDFNSTYLCKFFFLLYLSLLNKIA